VVSVPLSSPTRSNVTLVEPDGTTTKINEPGPELSADETAAMVGRVVSFARSADWVVLSGSLPRGVADDFYAEIVRRVHDVGHRVALDTSGTALASAVEAGPDLIKPNAEELTELTGVSLRTWGDVAEQAEKIRANGVGVVLVSLGEDGALLVDSTGVSRAYSPSVEVRSTVGAGDSTLAGFLAAGANGPDALRAAVAFGTAAVTLPGSAMPAPTDVHLDLVVVEEHPDLSRQLKGGVA
jgi:1-phosphofructokinase